MVGRFQTATVRLNSFKDIRTFSWPLLRHGNPNKSYKDKTIVSTYSRENIIVDK